MNGSWGYFMQGNGNQEQLDKAGSQLNLKIDCPVHYPAFNKRLFECKCGVIFPIYVVDAALQSGNWNSIVKLHNKD